MLAKISNKTLDLVSLGSPQSRVIIFVGLLVFLAFIPYNILLMLPKISLYDNLGIPSYSIGQTRALSLILHGQIQNAWDMNKLAFLLLFVLITVVVKDLLFIQKQKFG